jgi:hypothetical protein
MIQAKPKNELVNLSMNYGDINWNKNLKLKC